MRWRLSILGLALGLSCLPAAAWSIEIDTGAKGRVAGFLVREDAKTLEIRVFTPAGKDGGIVRNEKAKVKVLHRLNTERLEKLSKENPKAYRDYAEELAEKKTDPEAQHTAMRLFLIAAALDPQNLGASSLLRMSDLATSPAE